MGLSPLFVGEIFEIIEKVSSAGTTVLLVEQNAKKAAVYCRPCLCAGDGAISQVRERQGAVGRRRGQKGVSGRIRGMRIKPFVINHCPAVWQRRKNCGSDVGQSSNIPFHDREIIAMASEDSGVNELPFSV